MSTISGVAAHVRQLMARADALARGCETLAAQTQDDATRATLARAAGRLTASVIRPLRAAHGGAPAAVDGPALAGESDLADALHELAIDATRLRVRAVDALSLQEATAALQDLACQSVAGDAERLQARRNELIALLDGLPPSIQSAPDGPYLVTNLPEMTDWLGVSLAPTPQVSLCRCGASEIKPWCDGSHAHIGFHAGKSEGRVPDRLERYDGIGITIADNRGTCAHSGFCTDRLPSVFRTDRSRSSRRPEGASMRSVVLRTTDPPAPSAPRPTATIRSAAPTSSAHRKSRSPETVRTGSPAG